jgi:hypothetical protein
MTFDRIIHLPATWTAVSGRFGVHLFEGRLTTADMDHMEAVGSAWHRKNPGKLVELVVVLPSNTRMTPEERARMTALIRRWEHHRVASATVILAEGLLGAMQRSVLTGLMMLAPAPHPTKVFGGIAPAMAWLAPHLRTLPSASSPDEVALASVLDLYEAFQTRSMAR